MTVKYHEYPADGDRGHWESLRAEAQKAVGCSLAGWSFQFGSIGLGGFASEREAAYAFYQHQGMLAFFDPADWQPRPKEDRPEV